MSATVIAVVVGCLLAVIVCVCLACFATVAAYRLFWDYELHILMHPNVTRAKLRAARHVYCRSDVEAAAARGGRSTEMFEESGREYMRVRAEVVRAWEDELLPRPL